MSGNEHMLWFRMKFEGQFNSRQLMQEEVKHFFEDLAELIPKKRVQDLPAEFFNMDLNARRYADIKGVKADAAREQIIKRAEILLHLHRVPAAGADISDDPDEDIEAKPATKPETKASKQKSARRKVMPLDKSLYGFILDVREKTKKNPGPHSGRECLPDYSFGWSRILQVLRGRGETIVTFSERMEKVAYVQKCIDTGTLPTIEGNDIVAACIQNIRTNQALPATIAGHSALMVDACLRNKKVNGLSHLLAAAANPPRNLGDFVVAAGIAVKDGNCFFVRSPEPKVS
jgi:hypothetical protein